MGGSSSLNYMMYCRGHPNDYNEWERQFGALGWSWSNIGPLFQHRIENTKECDSALICQKCRRRGGTNDHGVMGISHKTPPNPLALAFVASSQALGFRDGDYNCQCLTTESEGGAGVVGLHQQTVRQGTRCDTARAYIDPITTRKNLFVLTDTTCQKIMTTASNNKEILTTTSSNHDGAMIAAQGVVLVPDSSTAGATEQEKVVGKPRMMLNIYCRKEVILSAGALASPQILLQSGIGPNGSVLELSQVGQNLQDHTVAYLHYTPKKQGRDIGTINTQKAVGSYWNYLWNKLQLALFHRGILTSSAYDASLFYVSNNSISSSPYYDGQISALCTPTNTGVFENNLGMDLDAFEFSPEDTTAPDAQGMVLCHTLLHPKSIGSVALAGKMAAKKNTAKGDEIPRKPKEERMRPLSAYNIFFKEERQRILDNPHDGKIGFPNLAKMIQQRWQELTPEQVEDYNRKQVEDVKRYKDQMEKYYAKQDDGRRKKDGGDDDGDGPVKKLESDSEVNDDNNNIKNNNGLTIHANYWSDLLKQDISKMTLLLRQGYRLANVGPLKDLLDDAPRLPRDLLKKYNLPLAPIVEQIPDAFWEEYIRRYATTLYHPVGTCRMGIDKTTGVVNHRLCVFGVANLRVADASVQPEIVSGNTNASCIVIGERAADILREDHGLESNPEALKKAVEAYEASIHRKRWTKVLALGGCAFVSAGLASLVAVGVIVPRIGFRSRSAY